MNGSAFDWGTTAGFTVDVFGTLIRVAHFGQRPFPPPALSGTRMIALQNGQENSIAMLRFIPRLRMRDYRGVHFIIFRSRRKANRQCARRQCARRGGSNLAPDGFFSWNNVTRTPRPRTQKWHMQPDSTALTLRNDNSLIETDQAVGNSTFCDRLQ
jgi:hypothetical protein